MKRITLAFCLMLIGNPEAGYAQSVRPRGFDPLLTRLVSVNSLTNYDHGFGGSIEFYELSKEFQKSHNESDFTRMVHSKNPIVKAMGLLCLAQLDLDKHWLMLLSHIKDVEEVYLKEGCSVSRITIGEFTQRILGNPYFLEPDMKRLAM